MSANNSDLTPEALELLQQRYGRRKSPKAWKFWAVLLLAVFLPWLTWIAWHHSNPEIRVTLISFQNVTEKSIEITYLVERRDPQLALKCTLLARDIDKNIVGEIEDFIPASNKGSTTKTTIIPTRIAPVNAAVLECNAA